MTIKINDKQFKILGMLSEIADDEIFNWSVENKPAIRHSILSRITDVDDKMPGIDKDVTGVFNRATHIDDNVICCVAVKIIAIARALLVMDLLGDSQILYNLLDDNFSKKHGVSRILRIRVKSAHTFEVSLVESMINKAFIEMCGIDSRMTESDQMPAVRILLKALSDN